MSERPPVTKYELTITIRGNSHDEIVDELLTMTRGGYLLASDHYTRDSFDTTGGRDRMVLEHTNPEQTPEAYRAELTAWVDQRREERRSNPTPAPLARDEGRLRESVSGGEA